jgi:DNA-binding XRE family transcriptional regulator
MRRDPRNKIADWTAGALAILVLALGGLVVVKPAIDNWDDLYRGDPFSAERTTQVVQTKQAGKPAQTTITRKEASASGVERALGKSGLLLLRVALLGVAALLVAAALQRAILGNYSLRPFGRQQSSAAPAAERLRGRSAQAPESAAAPTTVQNGSGKVEETVELESDPASAIGKIVASRRVALGLSQRELAKRAGISHTVISRIESGQHIPGAKIVDRLADTLS